MEEESNPNLECINLDEIAATLQDTIPNKEIIDINSEINENMDYKPINNNNEDIEMKIEQEQDIDPFLSQIVKRELEVLQENNHNNPISKKTFDDLNNTISKINMTNLIKFKKHLASSANKNN